MGVLDQIKNAAKKAHAAMGMPPTPPGVLAKLAKQANEVKAAKALKAADAPDAMKMLDEWEWEWDVPPSPDAIPPSALLDETGQFALAPLDETPFGWDSVDLPESVNDFGGSYVSTQKKLKELAAQVAQRRPEESIREYVVRLREMMGDESKRGSVASSVRNIEKEMADNLRGGVIGQIMPDEWLKENDAGGGFAARNQNTRDYIDYLAAHGVDQRTLDSIASGELDMSPQARMARAEQHDLDPKAIWHRWDHPLKTEMKGFTGAALSQPEKRRYKQGTLKFVNLEPSKEGLVYTSHSPEYAKDGVQIPQDQVTLYPLLGPNDGIAGLDDLPPSAYDTFRSKQSEALLKKYPDTQGESAAVSRAWRMRMLHLAEPLVDPQFVQGPLRNATIQELSMVRPGDETLQKSQGTIPSYSNAEDRKTYTEPLMASGAKGTLVRDETGLSTAFTPTGARTLRRADLAPLDTRFRMSRNLLQSLLAPVAVGAGAGALSQPSVFGGLRENR